MCMCLSFWWLNIVISLIVGKYWFCDLTKNATIGFRLHPTNKIPCKCKWNVNTSWCVGTRTQCTISINMYISIWQWVCGTYHPIEEWHNVANQMTGSLSGLWHQKHTHLAQKSPERVTHMIKICHFWPSNHFVSFCTSSPFLSRFPASPLSVFL